MTPREQRGLVIAATARITQKGNVWLVPSQSGPGKYTVSPDADNPRCDCPDFETNRGECKHIYAVRFVQQRELDEDAPIFEPEALKVSQKRPTYRQDWPAYNRAQTTEKRTFRCCCTTSAKASRNLRPRWGVREFLFAMRSSRQSSRYTAPCQGVGS